MTREILVAQYEEDRRELDARFRQYFDALQSAHEANCKEFDRLKRREMVELDRMHWNRLDTLKPAEVVA